MAQENINVTKGVVAAIGRWMPLHNGHKSFLLKLARTYERVVVMIGSCYEAGTSRNCIPAIEREKMLRAIFSQAQIPSDKYTIVHVPDTATFEEWILNIQNICAKNGVTHFCTGNKKDILDVLDKRGETLGFDMINPEDGSDFPYHATDIRKMIIEGNYNKLEELIPTEIKPILFRNSFKEIIAASKDHGIKIVPGRQAVDMIFLIRNITDGKIYVLLGKRSMDKVDFPGYLALPGGGIDDFESPFDAAIREFYEETGLKLQMVDNSLEPAIVKFENIPSSNLEQMFIVGIYSSEDENLAGSRGGSSQCFGVFVEDELYKYEEYLKASDDLSEVNFYEIHEAVTMGLAYQHGEMLRKAIAMFDAYPDLKKSINLAEEKSTNTVVISFIGASGSGKSTAALGTAFELKKQGKSVEYVQEFAKELMYNGLLEKYIPNQSYIVSEQYKRIYDLTSKVDFIVTDAGLEISALHSAKESRVVEDLAWYLRNKVNQITIFIERDENIPYEGKNRLESEAESRLFGMELEEYLIRNNATFIKVRGTDEAIKAALDTISSISSNEG